MKSCARRLSLGVFLLAFAASLNAAVSNEIDLFVDVGDSISWRTAEAANPVIRWFAPADATAASLEVRNSSGKTDVYDVTGLASKTLEAALPPSSQEEDVLSLTLTFTTPKGDVVRKGQFGLVASRSSAAQADARTVLADTRVWSRYPSTRAVLLMPQGTTSVTVDGQDVPLDLDGAAGWLGLNLSGEGHALSCVTPEGEFGSEGLRFGRPGMVLIVR